MTLLQTKGLCRSFGGLKAVSDVDFSLAAGKIRAVIGPNGAGKTTFVSLIAGRIAPTRGTIHFEGRDITELPAHTRVRRGIAYTFQITSIFSNLTAFENVALASHGARNEMDCLSRAGLADRADQIGGTLAYGHQRLLEVAMGLALRPRLIILDEPTQGLSDAEIANFAALVRNIAKETTVLIIEHNMKVVMALADRITVMSQGRVLAEGSPADIRKNLEVQRVYLGTSNAHA